MSGRVFSGLGFHQNIGRDTGLDFCPRSGIGQNLARIRVGKEKGIRDGAWEKFGIRDSREKKSGNAGSGSPFSDASLGQHFRGWSWRRRPTHLLEVSIELFSFYALFSQFRPRDALQGICLLSFHKICIYMRVEIVLCGTITWSEMGKQNIQVKKFYLIKRCIFSLALQRNLFPPDNPLYQRLTDLMQTRDPFYKPPQPSPVDETGASTKVSPTLLTFLLVETAP